MAYMSQEGYDNLVAELKQLVTVERPKASAAIAEARDKGDLSENSEYDAAKEAQAHLEDKINRLKLTIAEAKIIDTKQLSTDSVQIMSKVEMTYAFLDISPIGKGHTLVIPRKEVDYIFDMEDADLAEFEVFAKKVAKAIKAAFPCKKVAQVVLGLEVPHAHIHLIPMNSEADVNFRKEHLKLSEEEFKEIANKIYTEFQKL